MMKNCDILLIQPPHERRIGSGNTLPLGLGFIAAYLQKNGFKVGIIDCTVFIDSVSEDHLSQFSKKFTELVRSNNPKYAFGIGPCMTSNAKGTIAIAQLCRKISPDIPLIFGGPLASTTGQEWFFFDQLHATAVIQGDGEIPLEKCLHSLKARENLDEIEGVITNINKKTTESCIKNLDSLPFPARNLFPLDLYTLSIRRDLYKYPFATIMGTRGCPNNCPFCVTGALSKGKHRRRSMENIGMEISQISKQYGIRQIVFYDDQLFPNTSTINEDVLAFCNMMNKKGFGILWQVEFRPDVALYLEDKTIKYMYNSHCRQINFGIEKGYEKGMKFFGKKCHPEEVKELCKRIRKVNTNMRLTSTFILGGKFETKDLIMKTIEYSKQLSLLFAHYYPLELYPGTVFYQDTYGKNSRQWYNLILKKDNLACEIIYENKEITKKDLYNYIQYAYSSFYDRKDWLKLAKKQLGKAFDTILPIILNWKCNRLKGFPANE